MSIVLHHLEYSRSTRVIWLLEEMGTPYEMVRHQRDPQTFRAPPGLAEVHPLSKAPTVIVDGHVMVESGAIIEYLIELQKRCHLVLLRGNHEIMMMRAREDRSAMVEWLSRRLRAS